MFLIGANMLSNINLRLLGVLIFLSILSVVYILNQTVINGTIRIILEWEHLNITLWAIVIVSFTVHYLSARDNVSEYTGIIYKHFGVFADSAFAALTYGLASTTSAAILKGVYVQQFFGDIIYFNYFSSLDINSMLVVCLFLLGYSIWATLKAVIGAIILSNSEKAEPVFD